jgi:hypothetical protein
MPLKIKIRALLAIAISVLVVVITPAGAEAPHKEVTPQVVEEQLAFDNPKAYARIQLEDKGFDVTEYKCLVQLWGKESAWNYKADNPTSSAYGIAQMLKEDSKHPAEQIDNGIKYIIHRYDTPCNAWTFWRKNYWY